MASQARGLQNFISDLRNAKSKDEETSRINKELANIRSKFTNSSKLSSYQRKKYIWKLVYIHILGYEVDFGHTELLGLVQSDKFSEKQVGYVALSLLLRSGDSILPLATSTLRNDLTSNNKNNVTTEIAALALCTIANVPGLELAQALHMEVTQTLLESNSSSSVKKKAALCLLRLVRSSPHLITGREFAPHLAKLLQDRHLGVLTSVMSLLIGLVSSDAENAEKEYETLIPYVVHILGMLVLKKACAREYLYYRTPSPWLQIKLLKFLQFYPSVMATDKKDVPQLHTIVSKILAETDVSDSINKSNADHAILFEAVNLIVIWGSSGPSQLRDTAMRLLGKFISVREPNIRYLGLMTMSRLALLEGSNESIKKHQNTVIVSLKDADISVRRRALDLLFVMCDTDNAEKIVEELVANLTEADAAIREEMVLKIAILAEKYATDLRWYVDTILKLISIAGDFVSDSIWYRVVQIVTNHPQGDLQKYSASTLLVAASPRRSHEATVRVAAYILGEFGFLIAEEPGMSGEDQFRVLHQHWPTVDNRTRAILLTTYAKLSNLYEECRPLVAPVFARHRNSVDIEIQQRSCEYDMIRKAFDPDAVEDLLREMPPFQDRSWPGPETVLNGEKNMVPGGDKNVWAAARAGEQQRQQQQQSQSLSTNYVHNNGVAANEPLGAVKEEEEDEQEEEVFAVRKNTTDNKTFNQSNYEQEDEYDDEDEDEEEEPVRQKMPSSSPSNPGISTPTVGIPKEVIPAMRKAFSNLCTAPSGVLFENKLLQIGVKHEYRGCQGRISFFFGNLSSKPLTKFKCKLEKMDSLRVQKQGTPPGILEDEGCTVAVRTQAKLVLLVEVTAPYDDAPAMRVSFETSEGVKHDYPLRVPIVATCFMEPVTLEPGPFMQRWKSLDGEDREAQEIVRASQPITEESMSKIAKIVTNGLKFGRCPGVDPTPWTVSGAATFRTATRDASGNNINVGCLLRVEANPDAGAYRVTTRTLHPMCSRSVKNVAVVSIKII